MKKLLLLNIGNTHTQSLTVTTGSWNDSLVQSINTADWMQDINFLPKVEKDCAVWAACVVPQARVKLSQADYYSELHWVDTDGAALCGVDFSLVDSSTLGADRIANAVALLDHELPAVNIDCGTAVTMEVMLPGKRFAGGAIMPGRKLMRQSLFQNTAALPELALTDTVPDRIGTNTLESMQLGIDRGAVGMVREVIALTAGCKPPIVVASGGDAAYFMQAIPEMIDGGKAFTLRGIYLIACRHAEKC